ncbi:hypothetical protein MMB232_03198 [Brevundimonas subvibrioides]|uniref:hypothetical protein n=1 Tax=Brevundimonas subvibrioides TaxID=74313 RepID=UPI0032D588DC
MDDALLPTPDTVQDPRVAGVVIVVPSATYHPWNAEVASAAKDAGYDVFAYGGEAELPASSLPKVAVTHDPALVSSLAREWTVVLLGDVTTAPAQCAALFGATPQGGLQIASRILANMALLPADTVYLRDDAPGTTVRIGPDIEVITPTTREHWPHSPVEQEIQEALTLYQGWPDVEATSTRWAPALFQYDDRHEPASERPFAVEMTGRARALIYGPYIGLRPGRWSITVRFFLNDDAADHRLNFEWGQAGSYSGFVQMPGRGGEFAVTLTHDWMQPGWGEFRIVVQQGSLGGEVEMIDAQVTRVGDAFPDRSLETSTEPAAA